MASRRTDNDGRGGSGSDGRRDLRLARLGVLAQSPAAQVKHAGTFLGSRHSDVPGSPEPHDAVVYAAFAGSRRFTVGHVVGQGAPRRRVLGAHAVNAPHGGCSPYVALAVRFGGLVFPL